MSASLLRINFIEIFFLFSFENFFKKFFLRKAFAFLKKIKHFPREREEDASNIAQTTPLSFRGGFAM